MWIQRPLKPVTKFLRNKWLKDNRAAGVREQEGFMYFKLLSNAREVRKITGVCGGRVLARGTAGQHARRLRGDFTGCFRQRVKAEYVVFSCACRPTFPKLNVFLIRAGQQPGLSSGLRKAVHGHVPVCGRVRHQALGPRS